MKTLEYTITVSNGLHARPAGLLVRKAQDFDCEITLRCGEKEASLKKLLAVMGLGVRKGDIVTVEIVGKNDERCAVELKRFFEENL